MAARYVCIVVIEDVEGSLVEGEDCVIGTRKTPRTFGVVVVAVLVTGVGLAWLDDANVSAAANAAAAAVFANRELTLNDVGWGVREIGRTLVLTRDDVNVVVIIDDDGVWRLLVFFGLVAGGDGVFGEKVAYL